MTWAMTEFILLHYVWLLENLKEKVKIEKRKINLKLINYFYVFFSNPIHLFLPFYKNKNIFKNFFMLNQFFLNNFLSNS